MKRILILWILYFFFSLDVFSQTINIQSKTTSKRTECANLAETYEGKRIKKLIGKVDSPLDESTIVEIYKVSKKEFNDEKSFNLTNSKKPFKIYETDNEGNFYIKNLSQGYYILKFGIEHTGFNCTWINVQISKNGTEENIEVKLTIGI